MILFLDYDGVLHPDAAYLVGGKPELRAEGELFMWAPILQDILAPYPQVEIVLSTSWVHVLGSFTRTRAYLPCGLATRVIGATWHSAMARHHEGTHRTDVSWFSELSRYEQIARYVSRAGPRAESWLAIDDNCEGWHADLRSHIIETNSALGLSETNVQLALSTQLAEWAQALERTKR